MAGQEEGSGAPAAASGDASGAEPPSAGRLVAEGCAAFGRGELEEAARLFREALALDPDDVAALNGLGSCLVKAGRTAEAVPLLVDAVSLEPSRPETLANLASALERLALETEREDVRRAWVRALEALRSLGPESPEVWLDLGLAHGGEGPEAEGCLRRALELEPGRPEAADRLGAALIGRGALGDAERVFRDLVERHPMMAVGWAGLGAVAFRRGDAAAAEEHLARALKLDPSCERAHRALALVLEATRRPDDAVPHEEAGGMLRPDQVPGAWATAGLVLEGRGELRRARRCFERKNLYEEILCFEAAARLRPDDPDVAGRLSELYESYGDDARAGEWRLRFGKAARTKHSI